MMHDHKEQNWLNTASLAIIAVVALAAALIYTRVVMIPFVVALFIVALVSPIEDFQVKWLRLPHAIAIVVTLLVVVAVIAAVFLLIAQATTIIVSTAGEYSNKFAYMADKILEPIEYIYRKEEPQPPVAPNDPAAKPVAAPNDVKSPPALVPEPAPQEVKPVPIPTGPVELFPVVDSRSTTATLEVRAPSEQPTKSPKGEEKEPNVVEKEPNSVPGEPNEAAAADVTLGATAKKELRIDTQQIVKDLKNYIFNIVTNAFGTILGLISSMLFVIIFVLFLLLGRNPYTEHSQVYSDVVHKIRKYVGIKMAISAITGLLVWTTMAIIGLELAGVFGILAFLLNFIPSIGSIIATFLPLPIAVVQFQSSPWLIVLVVGIPGAIQILLGNVIEPKLQGEGLNLHPVTILLALSFWGLLWGIVGMFLAAPITAAIRIVLMQFDMLRPIAHLMAGDFTQKPTSSRPSETRSGGLLPG
ncbi:MAG TPA: AI-2E family transporter [Sedimentisphaerales bacterium]|jgi:AI-2 transport protein TqsA|nr:AI-2E family transporter [Sedimentisphaerales bacterium]HNU30443.1 AI-2E family transporter [Sedimentisphaerales bacterium]